MFVERKDYRSEKILVGYFVPIERKKYNYGIG
jgi:hypothetical protein